MTNRSIDMPRVAGALLAVVCAAVAATCAATGTMEQAAPPVAPSVPVGPAGSEPQPAQVAAPTSTAAGFADEGEPGDGRQLLLARFCMALQQLQRGEREQPVRVLWLATHTRLRIICRTLCGVSCRVSTETAAPATCTWA